MPKHSVGEAAGYVYATSTQCLLVPAVALNAGSWSFAPTKDVIYAIPLYAGRDMTLDWVSIHIITGQAGGQYRVALYENPSDSNLYPSSLLMETSDISATSSGVKGMPINVNLSQGALYWACLLGTATSTMPSIRVIYRKSVRCLGVDAATMTKLVFGWRVSYTYGSYPSTFPSGASFLSSADGDSAPCIGFRVAL